MVAPLCSARQPCVLTLGSEFGALHANFIDVDNHARELIEIATRRRMVDERTYLLLLDGVWFRVVVDVLPVIAEPPV
jgi:hypothetical protein